MQVSFAKNACLRSISLVVCSLKTHLVYDRIIHVKKTTIVHWRGANPTYQLQSSLLKLLCTLDSLTCILEKLMKDRSRNVFLVWFSTLGLTLDIGRWSEIFGICTRHSSYNMNSSVVCRFWSLARSQLQVWALVLEVSSVQLFSTTTKKKKIHTNVR